MQISYTNLLAISDELIVASTKGLKAAEAIREHVAQSQHRALFDLVGEPDGGPCPIPPPYTGPIEPGMKFFYTNTFDLNGSTEIVVADVSPTAIKVEAIGPPSDTFADTWVEAEDDFRKRVRLSATPTGQPEPQTRVRVRDELRQIVATFDLAYGTWDFLVDRILDRLIDVGRLSFSDEFGCCWRAALRRIKAGEQQ